MGSLEGQEEYGGKGLRLTANASGFTPFSIKETQRESSVRLRCVFCMLSQEIDGQCCNRKGKKL